MTHQFRPQIPGPNPPPIGALSAAANTLAACSNAGDPHPDRLALDAVIVQLAHLTLAAENLRLFGRTDETRACASSVLCAAIDASAEVLHAVESWPEAADARAWSAREDRRRAP